VTEILDLKESIDFFRNGELTKNEYYDSCPQLPQLALPYNCQTTDIETDKKRGG